MPATEHRFLLGLLAIVVFSTGCVPPCSNRVVYETMSPGGDHKAVVFERQCGNDGGAHTQVSVLAHDAGLTDEGGNVFSADMGFVSVEGGSQVNVQWTGPRELLVTHSAQAMIFKSERNIGDVSIVYAPR